MGPQDRQDRQIFTSRASHENRRHPPPSAVTVTLHFSLTDYRNQYYTVISNHGQEIEMEQQEQTGRITLADVRAAVEQMGGDPLKVGGAKVREALGRGGYTTIQKHLERLRAEAAGPEADTEPETAPDVPADLMRGLWVAAWAEAARGQAKALADALQRAEETGQRLAVALDDLDGLTADLDRLTSERDAAVQRAEAAESARQAEQQSIEGERAAIAAERQALGVMVERVRAMLPSA